MKTKALTASEVAQKILAMFPPTGKYTPNETDVFDKDGHAVVFVKEMPSGCSKVSGRMIGYKTYNQLKASEKKAFVANIESLKVDIVTNTHKLVRSVCEMTHYYIAGDYTQSRWMTDDTVLSHDIKPFNY